MSRDNSLLVSRYIFSQFYLSMYHRSLPSCGLIYHPTEKGSSATLNPGTLYNGKFAICGSYAHAAFSRSFSQTGTWSRSAQSWPFFSPEINMAAVLDGPMGGGGCRWAMFAEGGKETFRIKDEKMEIDGWAKGFLLRLRQRGSPR